MHASASSTVRFIRLTVPPLARSRLLNWNLSLGAVLALIVLVIPFGMCLLLSMRQRGAYDEHDRSLAAKS